MRNLEIKNIDCHAALAMTKSVQSGRSMIEMLGVLAIIGVLSVGGIAGYSKAMMKYRINKTIEQITLIAGNVRTFFASQGNYDGVYNKDVIKKAKLVPDEMWDGNYIKNVFGDNVRIQMADAEQCDSDDCDIKENIRFFSVRYVGLPTEACIELSTHNWTTNNEIVQMQILQSGADDYYKCGYGEISGSNYHACPNGSVLSIPFPIDIATDACSTDDVLHDLKIFFK